MAPRPDLIDPSPADVDLMLTLVLDDISVMRASLDGTMKRVMALLQDWRSNRDEMQVWRRIAERESAAIGVAKAKIQLLTEDMESDETVDTGDWQRDLNTIFEDKTK